MQSALGVMAISWLAFTLIGAICTCWATYALLRAAIRDGMLQYDERRRKPALPKAVTTSVNPGMPPTGFKWVLVPDEALPHSAMPMDMKAD